MSLIDRDPLIEGELAEEKRAETLFDNEMPYCNVPNLKTIKDLSKEAPVAPISEITSLGRPLKFIYKKDVPHESIIASKIISDLYTAGIPVEPIVLSKGDYNAAMNSWLGADSEARSADDANATTTVYCTSTPPVSGTMGCVSFDLAYSETWGPPYDPTSKLFDMTYEWGSGEADAVATTNLAAKTAIEFKNEVRALSEIEDDSARQTAYTSLLTTLHSEAVFMPLTRKQNIAVVNSRVSGFKFGSMEFDIPIAALKPTPVEEEESKKFPVAGIVGIVLGAVVILGLGAFLSHMIVLEKRGKPLFMELKQDVNDDPDPAYFVKARLETANDPV